MIITVTRTNKSSDGIFGNLVIDNDSFKCVTMENLLLEIPAGMYELVFVWSEHFQQIMPCVWVPGRSGIELHWANYPKQLEGCIALGTGLDFQGDMITESKKAWIGFVEAISGEPNIKIKIAEDYGNR